MLQFALDFLEKCGVFGLFAATALEASSLPFPGALFILIYGYIMDIGPWKLVLLAAANSVTGYAFQRRFPMESEINWKNFQKRG